MKSALFDEFLQAVRDGNARAAEELLRRYEPAIRRIVRLRLNDSPLRRLLDSTDICQSILAEFLARAGAGAFDVQSSRQLRGLLVTMALNKLRSKARHERRHLGGLPDGWDCPDPHPTPGQSAARKDLVDVIRQRLPERERLLFDRRTAGDEWEEIAHDLGGSPDGLRMRLARAVRDVRDDLQREEARHAG
jgi:RNA polymerase sigma factor (sigma-70 family)